MFNKIKSSLKNLRDRKLREKLVLALRYIKCKERQYNTDPNNLPHPDYIYPNDLFPLRCVISMCTDDQIEYCSKNEKVGRFVSGGCRFLHGGCNGPSGV